MNKWEEFIDRMDAGYYKFDKSLMVFYKKTDLIDDWIPFFLAAYHFVVNGARPDGMHLRPYVPFEKVKAWCVRNEIPYLLETEKSNGQKD